MNKSYYRYRLWFDRLLSKSLWKQFGLLALALVISFGLSYILLSLSGAQWKSFCEDKDVSKWLLPLYLLIDANALNTLYIDGHVHGWMLFVSSITFLIGSFVFNGAIIGIITNSIEQRVENHREGHIHYLKSGHYIIMGYDEMVPSVIMHIFEKDSDAYVLLLSAVESEKLHERLRKVFDDKTLEHIIINYGHRMSMDYYRDIHLESAEQVYIVGLRTLPTHDAVNVECVDSICAYLKQPGITGHPKRITCVFEDFDTYAAFKTSEIFGQVKQLGMEFVPYNYYSGWAKQVFIKRFHQDLNHPDERIIYPPVYGEKGIGPNDKKKVHLVFVGTSNFAVAFAMEAANVLHFPNFQKQGKKTLITFIDIKADQEKDVFIARNRHFFEIQSYYYQDLSEKSDNRERRTIAPTFFNEENGYGKDEHDFLDVEFEFIKGDVFSNSVQKLISQWAIDKEGQYLSLFLALADQRQNFIFGMNMPDEVYNNDVNIFVRQDHSDNFISNLRIADIKIKDDSKRNTYYYVKNKKIEKDGPLGGRYSQLYPFGMNETAYSADEKSLLRAKLINYLYSTANFDEYKFQSILALDAMSAESIWKKADEEWRKLNVALKWSNLYNAYALRIKLASLRAMRGLPLDDTSHDTWSLSDDEVEIMAHVEHNRWNVEKLLMGYRKPHREEDKNKDENKPFKSDLKNNKERFIHHDIMPYGSLGGIKKLDEEFSRYIPWIIRMTE